MKKISILAMAVMVAFSCNQKKQELPKNADVLADNLKGHVEQTTATDYKVDSTGKTGEQDSCCVVKVKYDAKGYITGYSSDNKAGTNKEEGTFAHYDNGAIKDIKNSKNGNLSSTISVRIDKDGKYSGAEEYDNGALKDIKNFKSGNLSSSISIQIDKDGKYSGAEEHDSLNKMKFYYSGFSQNDYGQLTAMKKYNADSTLSSTMSNNFDKQIYKGGEEKDSTGKIIFSSIVKLDNKNNTIESDTKNVSKDSTTNKVTKYKYDSFDDKDNWTQRTELNENSKPVKIVKRTITYYKE